MLINLLFVVIAYLLGAIPFGYLLVKYVFTGGEDIRAVGSGGTGATNVTRRAGWKAGVMTYLLDVAKGIAAVWLIERVASPSYLWIGAAALAVIIGHIFPIFLQFHGGKGVATGFGVFLILAPYAALAALSLFIVVVILTRYISLGSILAALAMPLFTGLLYGWLWPDRAGGNLWPMVGTTAMAGALIVAKHHENLRRLRTGTESKIGARVGAADTLASGGEKP